MQIEGLFDVAPTQKSELNWNVNIPIEDRNWNIGLIVGPSGSGKSTIAQRLFTITDSPVWDEHQSVMDGFPATMGIKEITAIISAVGFSSPPSWLRPFHVLSTGEQFRVRVARTIAEASKTIVIDEFTSVVDRTVAQIASAAIAKLIRKRNMQFVAVTCHEDVETWLQPDWIYRPDLRMFQWRELQRFPPVQLKIIRVHHSAWAMFRQHHYLNTSLNHSATCFVAFWNDRPVAFSAWITMYGRSGSLRPRRREHRTVVLPDFQGIGIGNRLSEYCASLWVALGYRVFSTTSHPGMIQYRNHSLLWRMRRTTSMVSRDTGKKKQQNRSTLRMTGGFEFIGPGADPIIANQLLGKSTS